MPPSPPVRCHLFCRVIDNFGDAGVCWRLARQLSSEFGWQMRLCIDRVDALRRLAPDADAARNAIGADVEIVPWHDDLVFEEPADVVVEAFACRLPDAYVRAMANRPKAPAWINLEYLSAEPWVESCHGLPSPDPASGLVKHYFFPGFTPATGGLIREQDHGKLAESFRSGDVRRAFLASIGAGKISDGDFPVSVFCYPHSPLSSLILFAETTWPSSRQPVWLISEATAHSFPELGAFPPDRCRVIPFLDQDDYDRLLLSCDLNFVRGEDSFVRAQLAGRPFVWQAYRQTDDAHRQKVEAFLGHYLADADPPTAAAVHTMFGAWNGFEVLDERVWQCWCHEFQKISDHNGRWLRRLESSKSLAERLVKFCESRL